MERRVFIAVLLSFVVLYSYQTYFAPPPPASTGKPPASSATGTPAGGAKPAAAAPTAAAPAPSAGPAPKSLVGEEQAREITVETTTARVVFTNSGARVVRWQLKGYRDNANPMVDLVPSGLPDAEARPFMVQVESARDTARLNSALY